MPKGLPSYVFCIPQNIIFRKALLSFVGRANHAAGLLVAVRPFLQELWAAIYSVNKKARFKQNIWRRQIAHAISWLSTFFVTEDVSISREFHLSDYCGLGDVIIIGADASPLR